MRRIVLVSLAALTVIFVPVGRAGPADRFAATIAPSVLKTADAARSYTIAIANQPNSSDATQGTIKIPTGFVLDLVGTPPSAVISSGPCAGHAWNVAASLTEMSLAAPSGGDALCDRGTLTVSFSATIAPLADGAYVWTTTLSNGSVAFLATLQPTLILDGTPPETTISGTPSTLTSASASFAFSGSDGGSGLAAFQCSLDNAGFASCASPQAYTGLENGAHTFEVRAVDAAGNVDPSPASWAWTADTVAPDTAIGSGPPALTTSRAASIAFSGSDSTSGVARFECDLDGGGFGTCASPAAYTSLDDGLHTFRVRAIDGVGNVDGSPDVHSWTVDATAPPSPVLTSAPSDPSDDTTPQFVFTDADPTAVFSCQLDGGAFTSCPGSFTTPPLLDGPHSFGVKATDAAGNASNVTSYSWKVDTVHPLASITSAPPLLTNETTATFSFQANKPTSTFRCSLDGSPFAACSSPRLYDGLGNGTHTFAVRAVWLALVGPPTEYTWTVDTVAPQTTIASFPPATSQNDAATFTFSSSEPESTFTCRLDGGGFVPCTSPKSYSGLGDGKHTFRVQAVDRAGNADASAASYSWTITGVGPPTQDLRPPANVRRLKRNVGYGRLQLRWRNPLDNDFDHVAVFVSTKRSRPPRTLLYTGRRQYYVNKRFKNGLYYRYLVVSYDRAENASGGKPATVPPSALLAAPRNGGTVRKAPTFRWAPVRRATFYNIQLYYRGRKVLSSWPGKARQVLTRRWSYDNRRFRLRRGLYVWYVWPGFGPRSKARYGQLLGQGTFRVR